MLRRLYDWTMSLADHPKALWALAAVSFIEASVFPIPPDVLMIPMILAAPRRAWLIALVATVSSVLGGLLGYGIGHFFFEGIGRPILEALGKGDHIAAFNARFNGVAEGDEGEAALKEVAQRRGAFRLRVLNME